MTLVKPRMMRRKIIPKIAESVRDLADGVKVLVIQRDSFVIKNFKTLL